MSSGSKTDNSNKPPSNSGSKTDNSNKPPSNSGSKTDSTDKPPSKPSSKSSLDKNTSSTAGAEYVDPYFENSEVPQFIYGGPFIKVSRPDPFLDTVTPINLPLQGTFKKTYAHTHLKDRLPVILTKVIDNVSRHHPTESQFINSIAKLKNDLITNKKYEKLKKTTDETDKWNLYIEECDIPKYFTNCIIFTECYVYRRIIDACDQSEKLEYYDPFQTHKDESFQANVEAMCMVAEKVLTMLPPSENPQRKNDFVLLLKVNLWSNKVSDLTLSLCQPMVLGAPPPAPAAPPAPPAPPADPAQQVPKAEAAPEPPPEPKQPFFCDPFQMVIDNAAKILVDDSSKFVDQIVAKASQMTTKLADTTEEARLAKCKCDCHKLAPQAKKIPCRGEEEQAYERAFSRAYAEAVAARAVKVKGKKPPPIPKYKPMQPPPLQPGQKMVPCPAKPLLPRAVQFDIVCDNYGYELFCDLCVAHFMISQKIVTKVRFHVKRMPWFVSDVTPSDFRRLVDECMKLNYSRHVVPPPPVEVPGKPPPPAAEARTVSSQAVNELARAWDRMLETGEFVVLCEDYWTMPHVYRDMKKYDYWMYRKLQYAVGILFKGDLNYRKLVGGKNTSPYATFESTLEGFLPAPILAIRTVKTETISGMKRGGKKNKYEETFKADPDWMKKGDYGVIQYCKKAEKLKVADRPCQFYCGECMGLACPDVTPFW